MPIVSFVVPVYNVEKKLHFCIDSILNQTYKDFELILVDDGSSDESGKICDKYALLDSRIKVIHKENEGVSLARNTGIKLTDGRYICFIDSDDYVEKQFLEALINVKVKYPDYDNIWCRLQTVDNYQLASSDLNTNAYKFYSTKDIMTLHEEWLDAGPVCKLYDKDIIEKNDIRFLDNLSLGEDLTFNFDYLDCTNGKILVIDCNLYNYMHTFSDSLSNKYYKDMFGIYVQLNIMMHKYMKKWGCDEVQFGKYYSACFYKYEVVLKNTFHEKCTLSKKEKYKYNNKILRSKEFIDSMNLSNCFIHPLYRFAYKSKHYRLVQIIDKIISLRNR